MLKPANPPKLIRVNKYSVLEPVTLYIVGDTQWAGSTIVKLQVGDTISYNYTNYTIDKNGKRIDSSLVYDLPLKPLPKLNVVVHADYNKATMNIYAHDWQGFTNEEIIEAFTESLIKTRNPDKK